MNYAIVFYLVLIIFVLLGLFVLFIKFSKNEDKKMREEYERAKREEIAKLKKRIAENEKAKESMETGDSSTDFINSIDILHNLQD